MKKILSLLFFAFWILGGSAATTQTYHVKSKTMHCKLPVFVVTPDVDSDKALPVLYLLHGYGGDHMAWQDCITDLKPIADQYQMIIVCPDAKKSWYFDSPVDKTSKFEKYVTEELIQWVDKEFKTIANRRGRAISGNSMGGHGAMWLSIRHKDLFGAVGTTSGGVDFRPFPENWEIKAVLGEYEQNKELWEEHTVFHAIDQLNDGELEIIIDCGYDDFFFEVNQNLHDKLQQKHIKHFYFTSPGEHSSIYWRESIYYQALFFKRYFDRNNQELHQ